MKIVNQNETNKMERRYIVWNFDFVNLISFINLQSNQNKDENLRSGDEATFMVCFV